MEKLYKKWQFLLFIYLYSIQFNKSIEPKVLVSFKTIFSKFSINMNNMNHHRDETNNKEKLFHRSESMPHVTQRIVEMLDLIEQRVELLREHASAMENERDTLLSMLSSIKSHKDLQLSSEGEREEIELFADRLLNRTLTVEVSVTTPRNEMQQLALNHVNQYLDELLQELEVNCENGKETLQSYRNACLSECKGPVHQKFQAAILECTAYDQKQTRKKLESLMASFGTQSSTNK